MKLNEFIIKKQNQLKEIDKILKSHEKEIKTYLKRDLKTYSGIGLLESYITGTYSLLKEKESIEQDLNDLNK